MSRRARRVLPFLGLLAAIAAGTLGGAAVPRWPALRCLRAFQEPVPADLERGASLPEDLALLEGADRYGARRALLRLGPGSRAPTLLFVHGVAPEGLEDGRIVHAVRAFGRAGFTVIAPELPTLVDPLDAAPVGAGVAQVLAAIGRGAYAGADPRRIGVVGISVGGALALRGCADFLAAGGSGLRAVLAIGAPDDLDRTSFDWFREADAAPECDGTLAWERAHAAAFARNYLVRAGLLATYGDDPEVRALAAWLAKEELPTHDPAGVARPDLLELARLVRALPDERAAAREGILARARARIAALSPAWWDRDLRRLAGVAVFLLHGHGDPLVPVSEVAHLARRIGRYTVVSVLESHMLAHTTVEDVGLAEQVAHLVQMDDFFDMIGR